MKIKPSKLIIMLSICLILFTVTSCLLSINFGDSFLCYKFIDVNYFSDDNPSIPKYVSENKYYEVEPGIYHIEYGYRSLYPESYLDYEIKIDRSLEEVADLYYTLALDGYYGTYEFKVEEFPHLYSNRNVENTTKFITNTKSEKTTTTEKEPIESGSLTDKEVTITWTYGKIINK